MDAAKGAAWTDDGGESRFVLLLFVREKRRRSITLTYLLR